MEAVQKEDDKAKKITQIPLNTPGGTCFLCLQDNQSNNEEGVNNSGGIINLSNICRYLNINQCSLLLASLKNGWDSGSDVEDVPGQLCSFSVNLCSKCLQLTGKLNDKIFQLEKAKLMVNYQLHIFSKVLEGTKMEENGNRSNSDDNFLLQAKLVQLLREETREKTIKILTKAEAAMPKVILQKCQLPPPALILTSTPSTIPNPPSATSIKTLLKHLTTTNAIPSKKSPYSKLYRCPYCSKIMTPSKFPLHLSSIHPSKLLTLSSHFPPSSSSPPPPPSESLCRQVLYSEVIAKAPKTHSPSTPSDPRLGCHLCGITYSNGNILKHHFLLTHTDKLLQEINKKITHPTTTTRFNPPPPPLSSSPSPLQSLKLNPVQKLIKKLLRTSMTSSPNSNANDAKKFIKKYQCPFCRKSLVYSFYTRHLANRHSDMLLSKINPSLQKLKINDPINFSKLCRKVLASQVTIAIKLKGSKEISSSSKLPCHLCKREFSEGQNLRHHFVVNHTDQLIEELIKMENVKITVGVPDKQRKKKTTTVNGKYKYLRQVNCLNKVKVLKRKKAERRWRSTEEKTCGICKVTFSKFDKLRRHEVSRHPDQLFKECRPRGMGEVEWRGKCKEVFRGEVRRARGIKKGEMIFKCGDCPEGMKGYKGEIDFVMHLVFQHREEMEGKLRGDLKLEGISNEEEEENEGGGDYMVVEEDASEFDVKPDMEFDELVDKEDDGSGGGDGGDNEVVVDDGMMMIRNMTDEQEQLELADNHQSVECEPQIVKMEVNQDFYFG